MRRLCPVLSLAALLALAAVPVWAQAPAAPATEDSSLPLEPSALPMRPPASPAPAQTTIPQSTADVVKRPPPTQEQIADSLQAQRRYQAAIAAYQKIEHPSAAVWNKMGIAHQMMFNLNDAKRCYEKSLKLDRRNATVINNLATVYDSSKNYRKAEKLYRKALKINPKSASIFKNLGTNLLVQRKYKKGWKAYEQAAALDPDIFHDQSSPQVQNPTSIEQRGAMNYYMARGCLRSGQTDCAIQYLRMAMNEGFTTPKKLASDADFEALRNYPAFKDLLAAQQQKK